MSDLIIEALVTRCDTPKLNMLKLSNTARCTFKYGRERLSIVIYDIDNNFIDVNEEKQCKLAFLTGDSIANIISSGDIFELATANDVIARGKVVDILSRP